MAIKARTITPQESETLDRWQRLDDIVRYRRGRILRLSEADWKYPILAEALGLHVETVRQTIKDFNEGGIATLAPGLVRGQTRPPVYTEEVAQTAEDLVRLTNPDPLYGLRKRQRDRLLALAWAAPEGAAVWLDESWFVRWPYRFRTWAHQDDPLRVTQGWNEEVDTTVLFAALDDESQEAFLRWAEGQPDSEEMVRFLQSLMAHGTKKGKRFIVLFWDKASWHTSQRTRHWVRAYNRRAKREGLTRLIVCKLPTHSPWLMPLESIFGWTKHQVLGDRIFETIVDLRQAVEQHFRQRVAQAKERRDRAWTKALATAT
jgi:hypothetical protein